MDLYEVINEQNNKSKEILLQYEKNANEKEKSKFNKINELNIEKVELIKKLIFFQNDIDEDEIFEILDDEEDINIYKKYKISENDLYNKEYNITEILDKIKNIKKEINKIKKINKYPHGNGIFGFALEYLKASKEINVDWTEYIYTWTIKGYKKVYPKVAPKYIEYLEDIKTSNDIMYNIYDKLRKDKRNCHEIFYPEWIEIINSYLKENNITIDDDIVFRPYYHNNMIIRDDVDEDIDYYRITKEDLDNNYDDDDDEFDFLDYIINK
jgi:hypothetical protein